MMDGRLKFVTVVLIAIAITAGVYFIPSSITGAAIFTETLSINDTAIAPNDVINPNIIVEPLEVVEPIEYEPIDDFDSQAIIDEVIEDSASGTISCGSSSACAIGCDDKVEIQGEGTFINADLTCTSPGTVIELVDGSTAHPKGGIKYFDCKGHTIKSTSYGIIVRVNAQSNIALRNCDIRYAETNNENSDDFNIPIFIENGSSYIFVNDTNITSNQATKIDSSSNIQFNDVRFRFHDAIQGPKHDRPLKVFSSNYFEMINYFVSNFAGSVELLQSDNYLLLNGNTNTNIGSLSSYLINDSHSGNITNVIDSTIEYFSSSNGYLGDSWIQIGLKFSGTSKTNLLRNNNLAGINDTNTLVSNIIQYDNSHGKYYLTNDDLNVNGQVVGPNGALDKVRISSANIFVDSAATYSNINSNPASLNYYNLGAYAAFLKDGVLSPYTEVSRGLNDFSIDVDSFSNWQANQSPVLSGQTIFTSDPTTDNTFQNVSVSATISDAENDQTRLYSSWYINSGVGYQFYFDKLMPFDDYHSNSNYSENIVSTTTTSVPWGSDVSWVHNGGSDNSGALRFNGSSGGLNMTTSISGSHTACVFFQNITGGSSQEFYYISDGSNEIRMFHWPGGGFLRFFFPGLSGENVVNPSSNNYVHLCYTYDDSNNEYSIYVNGELNTSVTGTAFTTPSNVYLGMKPTSNTDNGDSYLDDFILVDRAVSAEQIRLWSQKNYTTLHHSETGVGDIVRGYLRASDDYSYSYRQFTALKTITGDVTGCFDTDSPGTYTLQNNFNGLQSGKPYCIGVLHNNSEIDCNGYSLSHNMKDAIKDSSNYSVINHCEIQGHLVGVRSLGAGGVINDTQINVTGRSIEGTNLNLEVYNSVLNGTVKSTSGFNVTIADSEINGASLINGVYDTGDEFNASNVILNGIKVDMFNGSTLAGGLIDVDAVSSVAALSSYTPFRYSALNHSVNITNGGFEDFKMYWDPSAITTEDENDFELKQYSGGTYSSIPNTLNTAQDYINVSNIFGQITLMEFTNSPPSLENFEFTPNVYNTTVIDVNVTYVDNESHVGVINSSWYVNNMFVISTLVSNVANTTVLNRQFGPTEFSKGDTVNITFAVNDSYNVSNYNYQWTVLNSVPTVDTPTITYNGSALNCSVGPAIDLDLDPLTYNFTWYKNNVYNSTTEGANNFSLLNVTFNVLDQYNCSVKANDGTSFGPSSANVTYSFTNIAPVWNVNTWIAPSSIQDAFFNATYTDANGQNGTVNVSWYVNGVLKQSEIIAVDSGDYVNRSLTPGNFSRGDMINVTYNVTDGTDYTFAYNTGMVRNAGPTSSPSIVATHISNSTYENLTFIPGGIMDPEGDSPNVSHIGWTRNNDPYYLIYAPMDTNSSTVFDKSGNDFHGVSPNAIWNNSGTDGWFQTTYWNDIRFNTGITVQTDYSICFDLKLNTQSMVFAINSSTNSHRLSMEPHGSFGVDFWMSGSRVIKNDQPLPLGQWGHHCVLVNSTHLSYYYNGVFNMSTNYGLLSSHNPNHILFRPNGAVNNIIVVNGTISEDQITSFANGNYSTIVAAETNVGDVWGGMVIATDLESPGFPVHANNIAISGNISQCAEIDQPGSYTMVQDLSGTKFDYGFGDEACVYITASDVNFDCAGYNFTDDDGVVGDTAIAVIEPFGIAMENVTIENCNINDYYRSIDMFSVQNGTIRNITKFGGDIIIADNNNTVLSYITSVNDTQLGIYLNNSNASIEHSTFDNMLCIDGNLGSVNVQNVSCTGINGIISNYSQFVVDNTTLNTTLLVNVTPFNNEINKFRLVDVASNYTRSEIKYTCNNCVSSLEMYPGIYNLSNPHYSSVAGYVVNISGNSSNITFNYSDVVGLIADETTLRVVDQKTSIVVATSLNTVTNTILFNDTNSSFALVIYSDTAPVLSGITVSNSTGGNFIGNLTQANSSILYSDSDGDTGNINVTWEINDNDAGYPGYVVVHNESFTVANNALVKSNLSNIYFDKDDMLRVTWVAESNGLVTQQAIGKVINNTPPTGVDINLTYSSGVLNCSVNQTANDTDGDAVQYNYTLHKGAVYNTTYLGGEYYNTTVETGHTWKCTVFATDGDAGPSTFETLLVGLDTEPFFVNPFLRNDSYGIQIRTLNNVTASGIYNDNQSHVGNGTFRWYVQVNSMGPWVSVYNESFSGVTNGTNVTSTLDFGNFTELDVVKVNWSATANGLDSRDYVIFRTVVNTPPELLNVILNGSSPVDNITVFINAKDADKEDISNNTIWYKNGVQQPYNQFIMISSGNLTHGDTWNVTVWVNDSQSNSSNLTLSVNITDRPLVVDYVNLTAECGVNATANFSHTDYESQNATGFMYWYVNGGYVKNTSVNGSVGTIFNSTLYHGNFTHGDVLNITVNVTDGINNISKSNTTTLSCPPASPPAPSSSGGGGGGSGSKAPKPTAVPKPTVPVTSKPAPSEPSKPESKEVSYSSESHSGGRNPTKFRLGDGERLRVETDLPPIMDIKGVETRNQEKLLKFNNRPLVAVKKNILPANVYYSARSASLTSAVVHDGNDVDYRYPFEPVPVLPTGDAGQGTIEYVVGEDNGVTLLYEAGFFKEDEAIATIYDEATGNVVEVIDLQVADDIPFKTGIHIIDSETIELYAYHPGGSDAYIELNAVLNLPQTYCRFNVCELFSSEERYVEQYGPFNEGLFVQQFKVAEFIDVESLTMQWRSADGNIINSDSITGNVVGYGIIHIVSVLLVSALLIAYLMVRDVMRD